MATTNVRKISGASDVPADHLGERLQAANAAAQEIEILCIAMRDAMPNCEQPDLLARGISRRIQQLAAVIMSATGESEVDPGELVDELN